MEDFQEVGGEGEGGLLLQWPLNLGLLTIHSSGPPSSAKMLKAMKIVASTWGKTTQFEPWLATPFRFGVVDLTRDNGTNFPSYLMLFLMG